MFWLCRFRGSARLGLARSAVVVAVVDVVVDVVVVAVVGVAVAVVVAAASWQACHATPAPRCCHRRLPQAQVDRSSTIELQHPALPWRRRFNNFQTRDLRFQRASLFARLARQGFILEPSGFPFKFLQKYKPSIDLDDN